MKSYWSVIFSILLLLNCTTGSKKSSTSSIAKVEEPIDTLAPLDTGEVIYNEDEPFGEIIELKGRHITGDTAVYPLYNERILSKGDMIVFAPGMFEAILLMKLPEIKSLRWIGSSGKGPGEFIRPMLIQTVDTSALCYITDELNHNTFLKLTNNHTLEIQRSPLEGKAPYTLNAIYHTGKDYIYTEQSHSGINIKKSRIVNDSIETKELLNLNLREGTKSWAPYLGCFGVNAKANRMVYAYTYFRKLKFMDLDAKQIKTITFQNEKEFDNNSLHIADGLDTNVTYFYNIYSQPKYVYIFYSGRTPFKVYEEGQSGNTIYMYIEQYDWNGTPIHKYKIDKPGSFFVDEKRKKLYTLYGKEDEPFFEYDLP